MRALVSTLLAVLITLPVYAAAAPLTEQQKTLYAIGLILARQLSVFNLTPAEYDYVKLGLADGMSGQPPRVDIDEYRSKTQQLAAARRDVQGEKLAARAKDYLDTAAKTPGAVKTPSGLVYLSLKEGSGASPAVPDKVRVNYRGTFIDGREFDSSYHRGQPAEFPLSSVIKCWTEGVSMMKIGGKARLVCPPELAYGKRGSGIIPADATLIFEVELLDIPK